MTHEIYRGMPLRALSSDLAHNLFVAAQKTVDIPKAFHFSVAIVSDKEIHKMNKTYRKKDKPTDVLSFRYDDTNGEIVISAERVRAQAKEYGHSMTTEVAFLLVHGILHIMGWDHERSEKEAREMRDLEITILRTCGFDYAR